MKGIKDILKKELAQVIDSKSPKEVYYFLLKIRNYLICRFLQLVSGNRGTLVTKEKWDNLIILDSCRYDVFKQVIDEFDIRGKLGVRLSRGSTTHEFLRENFKGDFKDIIYITYICDGIPEKIVLRHKKDQEFAKKFQYIADFSVLQVT